MDAFHALAEPRRRRILELIAASGQLSATEISSKFDITAQAISQHLGVLLQARLVTMHRQAQQRIYGINQGQVLEVEEWAEKMLKSWNEKFDRLEGVIESERKNAKK